MLFDSLQVGSLHLHNRIVMSAINLGYAQNGEVNQRHIDLYSARSRGGAGLIMIGGTAIEPTGTTGGFLSLHADHLIEGHEALTSAIKKEGASVGVQLFQSGRYSFAHWEGKDVFAPSPIASRLTKHTPRELSTEEVYEIIESFGKAAVRAKKAGYELIEVIMSAGYLVSQFLSPVTNHRTDEFGGNWTNRKRFALEIINTIRSQVGDEFPLSVRLGASDFIAGGNTLQEMAELAEELAKTIDMINVTGGWHESLVPQIQTEVPRGAYSYLARTIKEHVNIPVVASNRINAPEAAEKILQNHEADLVTVARGFLADPDWGVKAQAGNSASIRKCIGCMNCFETLFAGQGVSCAINPACGHEAEATIKQSASPRRILIVGAGPAGLEAARVFSLKGDQVTLWEKSARIGGQWNIASIPPGKKEFTSLLGYYAATLQNLGVDLVLNKEANTSNIAQGAFDMVFIATGANAANPPIPVKGDANIINAWDVLQGKNVVGPNIVVVGGGSVGCETALYLAEKGTLDAESLRFLFIHQAETPENLLTQLTKGSFHVQVVEMGPRPASDMISGIRWTVRKQMHMLGVQTLTQTRVLNIDGKQVHVLTEQGSEEILMADTVVMAVGAASNNKLYTEIKDKMPCVYLLGDAEKPGKVADAIHNTFHLIKGL